jgi:hypothetical protein
VATRGFSLLKAPVNCRALPSVNFIKHALVVLVNTELVISIVCYATIAQYWLFWSKSNDVPMEDGLVLECPYQIDSLIRCCSWT